jgi:protein ImuB
VYQITLEADLLVPLAGASLTLFHDHYGSDSDTDWSKLVERLRARLGHAAVHGLTIVAEHRPEYAVRHTELTEPRKAPQRAVTSSADRPLWLLATPQPLVEVDAKPYRRGPLALVAGPERIESGWWDGHDVRRDYFIAQDIDRSLLWVYRDPAAAGWFLHGLFA